MQYTLFYFTVFAENLFILIVYGVIMYTPLLSHTHTHIHIHTHTHTHTYTHTHTHTHTYDVSCFNFVHK